ncbi:hypothetical protein BDW22DRAFT_1321787 [Trametopsis cervina]|nr:hypothetical protein BDW22DRAFT_1321787 [Trametopsis cervina]
MASTHAPNPRAHLLAGLRTGGVRSASGPVPHTAAPAGTFNIPNVPRYSPGIPNEMAYLDEEDELADMVSQNMYFGKSNNRMQQPMTAAVDGGVNRFAQQQQAMNGLAPMSPYMSTQTQMQNLQMQMMQMEIARLQTLQAQQYQAELLAQAQAQQRQRQSQPQRRSATGFAPPATAGPTATSFDMSSHGRRTNQADQLRAMLGLGNDDQVPMTAALGGRFGSRMQSGQYENEGDDFSYMKTPATPHYTSVISGGTALGSTGASPPSKSDAAVSWRRGGSNNSVLSGNRAIGSPVVKITPPPAERTSPSPPASSPLRTRPPALQFSPTISQSNNMVAIDASDIDGEDTSSVSSKSGSTPSTPRTASSLGDAPPLSPREEASKKLYEGLGIGRPVPTVSAAPLPVQRAVVIPVRQPRGPPSNNDELKPKNFATRSRRKAIGALGALLDARERRETVEVC